MHGEGLERDMPKELEMSMGKPRSGCGALKDGEK